MTSHQFYENIVYNHRYFSKQPKLLLHNLLEIVPYTPLIARNNFLKSKPLRLKENKVLHKVLLCIYTLLVIAWINKVGTKFNPHFKFPHHLQRFYSIFCVLTTIIKYLWNVSWLNLFAPVLRMHLTRLQAE